MKHAFRIVAVLLLPALLIVSCSSDKPVAPQKSPVVSFFPSTVGSYWIYADTAFDVISSQVISATIDSIAVIGVYRDTLGTWLVLNHSLSWVSDTFMVKGDTLFSRELGYTGVPGPDPIFTSAQYIPAHDTAFVFNVLHEDMMERRTVKRVDSAIVCGAGTFDGCVLYYEEGATEIVYRDILAPKVGIVYYSLEIRPMGRPDIDNLYRHWLVRYHVAE